MIVEHHAALPAIDSSSSVKREIVQVAATIVAVLSGLAVLAVAILAAVGDQSAETLALTAAVLVVITALAASPLWLSGIWFRLWVALLGLAAVFFGFLALVIVAGAVLIGLGLLYLALAWTPDDWSKARIIFWL